MKERIFTTHLDDDVYKFYVGCIFWDKFKGTPAEYAYKCRDTSIDLSPIYNDLCEQIEMMQDVSLQKEEQKWLFESTKTTQDYLVNFLSKFRFHPSQIKVEKVNYNPGIVLRPTCAVEEASLWEMPLMYTTSELYFKNMYGDKFNSVVELAKKDLHKKVEDLKKLMEEKPDVKFTFSEFGTRRRLCAEFQDYAIKYLKDNLPDNLVGTSNMLYAKKHNCKAIGTVSHEFYEFYQAFYHILDSQKIALKDFIEFYRGWLGIALTDTLGSNQWDRDFSKKLMIEYLGQRHDSANPYTWAERRIAAYEREGVDPKEKTLLWSDDLTFKKAFDLCATFCKRVGTATSGLGTFVTNNIPSLPGHKALNQVVKIVKANGRFVAKISDDSIKSQCEDEVYLNYVKHTVA